MTRECTDADIVIAPAQGAVSVFAGGTLVARSDRALALKEGRHPVRYYLPPEDVLVAATASARHTVCPFKGEAAYRHLDAGGKTYENAIWYYPDPCPQVAQIAGYLSFWGEGVRVEA